MAHHNHLRYFLQRQQFSQNSIRLYLILKKWYCQITQLKLRHINALGTGETATLYVKKWPYSIFNRNPLYVQTNFALILDRLFKLNLRQSEKWHWTEKGLRIEMKTDLFIRSRRPDITVIQNCELITFCSRSLNWTQTLIG